MKLFNRKQMKKVICFVTFDLFHLGHLNYFKQAKTYGDYLIVVLARDKTKQEQQKEMVFTEEERLELIKNLKLVDEAVLGYHHDFLKIIQEHQPQVICLGYDHQIKEQELTKKLNALGLNITIQRMKPYNTKQYKSTLLKEKILKIN